MRLEPQPELLSPKARATPTGKWPRSLVADSQFAENTSTAGPPSFSSISSFSSRTSTSTSAAQLRASKQVNPRNRRHGGRANSHAVSFGAACGVSCSSEHDGAGAAGGELLQDQLPQCRDCHHLGCEFRAEQACSFCRGRSSHPLPRLLRPRKLHPMITYP